VDFSVKIQFIFLHPFIYTTLGVLSPTLSGTTQLDSYRPLLLPTILIGDAKLGGISSTISSYESLLLRGYTIDAVLLFRDGYYRNWEYLKPYFDERGIHVSAVDPPPPRITNPEEDLLSTEQYYQMIVPQNGQSDIYAIIDHLNDCHTRRIQELDSLPRRTLSTVWWPFVQHGLVKSEKDVTVIDSASSDFFSVYNSQCDATQSKISQESLLEPQFDGSASWWTQALGHAHPELTLAAAGAAGRYGHVMFPQATHLPALQLAERLVHEGPGKGWASRVFFSDDGSTAMEIAIKMALRAYCVRHGGSLNASAKKTLGIVGLKGSYHGDTIGSMDACEEGVFTCEWHSAKGYWFEPPTVSIRQGKVVVSLLPALAAGMGSTASDINAQSLSWVYDVPTRLDTPLADLYREYIRRTLRNLKNNGGPDLAAVILEPLVMGAGGMIFVDPLFQRILVDVIRGPSESLNSWSGLPVIFDEVFVGLYRIGMESTGPLLGVYPDISVNAKILTGGLVPMAATLASDSIFQAFMSDKKTDALLHGHSYTAHPIGCAVANKTLDIVQKLVNSQPMFNAQAKWAKLSGDGGKSTVWSLWDPDFVHALSYMPMIAEVMTLGTVLAIKFKDEEGGKTVVGAFRKTTDFPSPGYGSHSAQMLLQSIKGSVPNHHMVSSAPGGAPFGINYRTLGNVAYFMTSLNTTSATIRSVEDRIWSTLVESTTS
jgi:bifunctional dethiobiotin synthetase / adenosylmethionine---8-amino-7-oxononanoate aminotransferase